MSAKWFSLQAPWLSQLHSLILAVPDAFNATQVLIALARIPALEHLVLNHVLPPTQERLQPVYLPHLRTLHISRDFTTSLLLLKCIVPSVGSSLFLDMHKYEYIHNEDMHDFCTEIRRYIDNFFGCTPFARSLIFEPSRKQFNIIGWRSSDVVESPPDHADFSICIAGGLNPRTELPISGPQELTTSFSTCSFPHITAFEFRPTEYLASRGMRPSLISFFWCLHSVNHLLACTYSLSELGDLQDWTDDTIFPLLTTLQIRTQQNWCRGSTVQVTFPVTKFLEQRIAAGKPIATLDISALDVAKIWLDWTHLDSEIKGLKVIVRRNKDGVEEYVCGTGTPEKLNMRKGFNT